MAQKTKNSVTYICPMHPAISQHRPGHCPSCGMALRLLSETAWVSEAQHDHHDQPDSPAPVSAWQQFKQSMTMTMGMNHAGSSGRAIAKQMELDIRDKFWFSFLLTIPIILYSPLGHAISGLSLPAPLPLNWWLFILTTPVFLYGGWLFLYSAFWALKHRTLDMSVLIAVSISTAYGLSLILTLTGSSDSFYEAAAMLITFVLFGHWLEMKSRRGTTDALQALFALVPPQARVQRNGTELLLPTSQVKINDLVVVKPGDKIPVDGEIVAGETAIDESLMTGESLPVTKTVGDQVIGGSLNQTGLIRFRATKVGEETALAQIVRLVETAQNSKAPGQRLADRWASYLVIIAVASGLLTFAIWFFIIDASLMTALTFAIATVVVACPDALGLATPTAVAVGTGLGAKHSILIKDAATLEQLSKIQVVVLDKTGTLTAGQMQVTDVIAFSSYTQTDILRYGRSLEAGSNHPLAAAIVAEAERRLVKPFASVEKFTSLAGYGLQAQINHQKTLIGRTQLFQDHHIDQQPAQATIDQLTSEGKTVSLLAIGGKLAGLIAAADTVKPTAKRTIEALDRLGLETIMMTGDNHQTGQAIAQAVGIGRVFSEVAPTEKAAYLKQLQTEGKFVAMVGDGVNDAPALAQADIGIAIGAGTDVALETAQVVLMKSDPLDIVRAIKLSQATVRKMKQNLFWASIYNLVAIPIAAGVLSPSLGISLRPEIAALFMSISSIIVATNAVFLNRSEKNLLTV